MNNQLFKVEKMNKKLSVLIVDDDLGINESLVDILVLKGHEAVFATSGKESLSLIKEKKFDAVLLDMKMPVMNGLDTLVEIKKHSPLTSVVIMTAYAEDKLIEQAIIEGALQILLKPLDVDKIINFLEKLKSLKSVLIVDDDKTFCNAFGKYLDTQGYKVVIAYNVKDALEKFYEHETEILLVDLKLEGETGLDIVNTIREKGYKSAIILMSSVSKEFMPEIGENLKKKNVQGFIEKPFTMNAIIELLGEVARKRLQEVLA